MNKNICVIGAGYVGLVTAACLANFGHNVFVVEKDPTKRQSLIAGWLPFYEPGLAELVGDGMEAARLSFFGTVEEATLQAKGCEFFFVCVGTPAGSDGSCDTSMVEAAAHDVALFSRPDAICVLKSTVPVGTARLISGQNPQLVVVNNPEFLKEGDAIADFVKPERVVLGGSREACERVQKIYGPLVRNDHKFFLVSHETAELSKLASNLALASRVSLINQIGRLSQALGASIRDVSAIMRTDSRIGTRYLFASLGFGGSCFPKDVLSFVRQCELHGVDPAFARSVIHFNESQKLLFIEDILKNVPKKGHIALLGTAFKPNTDDIRDSPSLAITNTLAHSGYEIKAYDPKSNAHFFNWIMEHKIPNVDCYDVMQSAVEGASAVVIVTEWQEFRGIDLAMLHSLTAENCRLYDGKNIFSRSEAEAAGFIYMGTG